MPASPSARRCLRPPSRADPVRRRLLDLLVRARLVTSADGGYDLAHEALVRAWPRLRVLARRGPRRAADPSATWRGRRRLGRARPARERALPRRPAGGAPRVARRGHEPLDDAERAFVEASRAAAATTFELAEEARRQRHQNRRLVCSSPVQRSCSWSPPAQGWWPATRDSRLSAAGTRSGRRIRRPDTSRSSPSQSLLKTDRAVRRCSPCWPARQPDALAQAALRDVLASEPDFLGYRFVPLGANAAAVAVPHEDRILIAWAPCRAGGPGQGGSSGTFNRPFAYQEVPSALRVSADGTRAVRMLMAAPARSTLACRYLVVFDLASRLHISDPIPVPFPADQSGHQSRRQHHRCERSPGSGLQHRNVEHHRAGDGSPARRRASAWPWRRRHAYLGASEALCTGSMRAPYSCGGRSPRREFREQEADHRGWHLVTAGSSGHAAFDLESGRRLWPVGAYRVDFPWVQVARSVRVLGTRLLRSEQQHGQGARHPHR